MTSEVLPRCVSVKKPNPEVSEKSTSTAISKQRSQFQNSSTLSKRPRFDLRKGAFSAVILQVAASNSPLQFFAMPSLPSFELLLKLPLQFFVCIFFKPHIAQKKTFRLVFYFLQCKLKKIHFSLKEDVYEKFHINSRDDEKLSNRFFTGTAS